MIKSEEGLEKDLTELYEKIAMYNNTINEAMRLGELRTKKHFRRINAERKRLHSEIEKIGERRAR